MKCLPYALCVHARVGGSADQRWRWRAWRRLLYLLRCTYYTHHAFYGHTYRGQLRTASQLIFPNYTYTGWFAVTMLAKAHTCHGYDDRQVRAKVEQLEQQNQAQQQKMLDYGAE